MKTLLIFRHGETDWNVAERFQGHLDIPLNSKGKEQARALVPLLSTFPLEAILSSDLSRALETAAIVARELNLQVFQDKRLREAHLGDAQGLTRKEIEERFGSHAVERWKSPSVTDADVSYPGGETGNQIFGRTLESISDFLQANDYLCIGVASHGGVIRRMMQRVLPPDSPPVPIPNGVVYRILYDAQQKRFHKPDEPFMIATTPMKE